MTFSGLRLPQNEAQKFLQKIEENSEQNSGQNSGRKFENFGKLSFCNFSDLKITVFRVCFRAPFLPPFFPLKEGRDFQAKSGGLGPCPLFLHFLGKIAVQKMSGKQLEVPDILLPDIRDKLTLILPLSLSFPFRPCPFSYPFSPHLYPPFLGLLETLI